MRSHDCQVTNHVTYHMTILYTMQLMFIASKVSTRVHVSIEAIIIMYAYGAETVVIYKPLTYFCIICIHGVTQGQCTVYL